MTVNDVFEFLSELAPVSLAESYDNVGLLVGNKNALVSGIVVALDCTEQSIELAKKTGANLIVTHHPVIFHAIKSVRENDIVYRLVRDDISVISMHTNLDKAEGGVNDCLCEKIGLLNVETVLADDGFPIKFGELEKELSADDFASFLKEKLSVGIRYSNTDKMIKKVAVCSGSGASFVFDAKRFGADALLTADVRHNHFISSNEIGVAIFDGGHFNTEDVVVEPIAETLKNKFPKVAISVCHFSPIKSV